MCGTSGSKGRAERATGPTGAAGPTTVTSDTIFTWADQQVWVSRSELIYETSAYYDMNTGGIICPAAGFYALAGAQTITVTTFNGQGIHLDPPVALVHKGTTVRFTATMDDGTLVDTPNWMFIPAPGVLNATGACGVTGPNPCDVTVQNSGELRVSKWLGPHGRSDKAAVRVYTAFEVRADKPEIKRGTR
jgi:hypothetical protein